MTPTNRDARVAGFLYLFITVTGVFNLMYAPSKLFVRGDPAATANTILAHESLFRIDLVVGVAGSVGFALLAFALYRLLEGVNRPQAAVMAALVLVQVPQSFVSEVNNLAVLVLVRGAEFLSVFDKPQREAIAMLFLQVDHEGTLVSQVFWGLWLFPLGLLVWRSGFLPRVLGGWLLANGFAYLANAFTGLLAPQHLAIVSKITFPVLFGEMAFMLWLVIVGVRPKPRAEAASAPRGQ
ncbi:MAG TPA: DUF4386 domain-containing protein [Thermoanaerobaculaceae bacterium]|nr:DUF4386 domain-containing protein [Thermoanaerobaculaceae bacterium]